MRHARHSPYDPFPGRAPHAGLKPDTQGVRRAFA